MEHSWIPNVLTLALAMGVPGCYATTRGIGDGIDGLLLMIAAVLGVASLALGLLTTFGARRLRRRRWLLLLPAGGALLLAGCAALVTAAWMGVFEASPPSSPIVELAPAGDYACARVDQGQVFCGGGINANREGELGSGDTSTPPDDLVEIEGAAPATRLWQSGLLACAQRPDREFFCWGRIDGEPTAPRSFGIPSAVAVTGSTIFVRGADGWEHHGPATAVGPDVTTVASAGTTSCVLDHEGRARCAFVEGSPRSPVALSRPALALAVTAARACAILEGGEVRCWSADCPLETIAGQPAAASKSVGVHGAVELVAGQHHFCALLASGGVVCWGQNGHGELGAGDREPHAERVEVVGIADARRLHAGPRTTCTSARGGVFCWGDQLPRPWIIASPAERINGDFAAAWLGPRFCFPTPGAVSFR